VTLVAVAGCLFEVHLDRPAEWVDDGAGAVSLIASHDGRRLRFRAEREGEATLRFVGADGQSAAMPLRIAPESG